MDLIALLFVFNLFLLVCLYYKNNNKNIISGGEDHVLENMLHLTKHVRNWCKSHTSKLLKNMGDSKLDDTRLMCSNFYDENIMNNSEEEETEETEETQTN